MVRGPNFCVHEELPYILFGTFVNAIEPGVLAAELLKYLRGMVIESSLSPVALISKVELEAAISGGYLHALPVCTKHESMDARTGYLAEV